MSKRQLSRSALNPDQKRRAEQLISLFENGTIEIQYGYAETLGDGRGITTGRAGFTTRDGDALEVVEIYTRRKPENVLAAYLPRLRVLADKKSGSTKGLRDYKSAWREAARDSVFRAVQDEVTDRLYYQPSVEHSENLGLQTALSRAVLYDSIIQHGDGDDADGLQALIERTGASIGGSPQTGIDEKVWLRVFLRVRREDLAHPHDPETAEEWAESVGRCDVFSGIAANENYDLHGPIEIHTEEYDAIIP